MIRKLTIDKVNECFGAIVAIATVWKFPLYLSHSLSQFRINPVV